ncbi:MAG: hypothetical protein LRZ84_22900 [Desertifilum sp.]|nr:hypothetical protein [Desertifilum sp.]
MVIIRKIPSPTGIVRNKTGANQYADGAGQGAKSKLIAVRLRQDIRDRLEEYLDNQEGGLTLTWVVEEALDKFLPSSPSLPLAQGPPQQERQQEPEPKEKVKLRSPSLSPSTKIEKIAPGPEGTNEHRTNEDRLAESAEVVAIAVDKIKARGDWEGLNVRGKIAAIKEEVRSLRGAAISTQTLYRDHVKPLWN